MKITRLTFAGLLLFSNMVFAELYQWRDSAGQVHYTDDPGKVPSQQKAITQSDTPKTVNLAPAMSSRENIMARQEQNAQIAQQEQQLAARAADLSTRCKIQATRLEQLKSYGQITTYKDDGSIYYLTEQERSAYIQKEVEKYQKICSNL